MYMKSHMGQVWPDRWTSFSVNVNMSSRPHQDCHNAIGSDNVLATFGSFQGGGLWREVSASAVQERGESVRWKMRRGKRVPGEVVDTFHNPTVFDPKGVHATMAWAGKRISITLYTVRAHDQVCGSDVDRLQELAFPGLTAVHYMEVSCTEHGGHEARQAMECEHDFETVFEGHRGSSPMPSMLKQMLSSAANWLSRHRPSVPCPEPHVQPHCAREPRGGAGGSGGPQPQEAFYECEEDGCGVEKNGAADPLDAGHSAATNGFRLPAHPEWPERGDLYDAQDILHKAPKEPQSSHCPRDWGTAPKVDEPQDLAVRASGLSARTRPPSLQSEPQGLLVDMSQVRQPLEEDMGGPERCRDPGEHDRGRQECDRSSRACLSQISSSSTRTSRTRTAPGGARQSGQGSGGPPADADYDKEFDYGGDDHYESWTSCFFGRGQHGASIGDQERTALRSSSNTPSQDSYENASGHGGARDLHRRGDVRRGHDSQPRRKLQVMISGEELERSNKAPLRGLCGDLRKRGWSLCALMVLFTLSTGPATCTRTFLGHPVECGKWSEATGQWSFGQDQMDAKQASSSASLTMACSTTTRSVPSTSPPLDHLDDVRCYAFYKDNAHASWMADLFGKDENIPRTALKDIQQALVQGGVDVSEVYSPPRLTARAKRHGLRPGTAMDLATGWNFAIPRHR